jgi:phage tail-like protein
MSPSDDLYRKFPFRVKMSGRYVAGFLEVSPLPQNLKSTSKQRSCGPPTAMGLDGRKTPFFINLERGISFDLGFEQWVSMVRSYGPATGEGSLLPEYKRPFTIEACDENGEVAYSYHLSHCWVTGYTAVPNRDASSYEIAIEHLRLGFDQWERDPLKDT